MNQYTQYLLKKSGWYLLTLLIALTLNFILPRLIKGNPIAVLADQMSQGISDRDTNKRLYETFAKEFGIDKPLPTQFWLYLKGLVSGELGTSLSLYPRSVASILGAALPWTIALWLPGILLGWLLGNLLGAYSAYKKGFFDKIIFPSSLLLNAVPGLAMGLIYVYIFAVSLKWFPIAGGYSYLLMPSFSLEFILSILHHYALPFLTILITVIGQYAIGMREMCIYELNSDYVLYGKLLGIRDKKVVRYVFRNAMLPQITGLAVSIGMMVAGNMIIEIIYSYPGIGTLLFKAIRGLDYPLISGCTLLLTLAVLAANYLIDIIYGLVDPRVKTAQMEEN